MEGLRYEERGIAIIERPPVCRTIFVKESFKVRLWDDDSPHWNHKTTAYRLAFPWQVYCLCYTPAQIVTLHLAFRNAPMTQEDQTLYYPNLWNIYTADLRLCLGDAGSIHIENKKEMDKFYHMVIAKLWGSMWTCAESLDQEYTNKNAYVNDLRVGSIAGPRWEAWAENTQKNPDFITEVKWPTWGWLDTMLIRNRELVAQHCRK